MVSSCGLIAMPRVEVAPRRAEGPLERRRVLEAAEPLAALGGERGVQHLGVHRALRAEVRVEASDREAGAVHHPRHAGGPEALAAHQPAGDADDPRPGAGLGRGPPPQASRSEAGVVTLCG